MHLKSVHSRLPQEGCILPEDDKKMVFELFVLPGSGEIIPQFE